METLKVEQNTDILKNVGLFSDLKSSPEAMQILSKIMKSQKFHKGHILLEQGKAGNEFFVLVSGTVSVFKTTPEGDDYKVAVLNHAHHPAFGEGGLMPGEVRSATIKCETDVVCLALTQLDFSHFCENYPQFALPVFRRIAQALIKRLNETSNDLMMLHRALMEEIRNS